LLRGRNDTAGSRLGVSFEVSTSRSTPHGDIFDPATYLIRTEMSFDYQRTGPNGSISVPFRMVSRGFIGDQVWESARKDGGLDVSVIDAAHGAPSRPIIGVLTETSFVVQVAVPVWPVALLGSLIAGCVALGGWLHHKEQKRRADDRGSDQALEQRSREPRQRRRVAKQR
jgi:hypothetical protein